MMFDGEEDKPHDREEEGSYAEFRVDFSITENDDGTVEGAIGAVSTHVHHVPAHALIDALLIVAKGLLAQQMGDMVHVPESAPQALREHMLDAFAGMYLKQRIDSDAVRGSSVMSVSIPNDISELLD
jgi:hypothetical protein